MRMDSTHGYYQYNQQQQQQHHQTAMHTSQQHSNHSHIMRGRQNQILKRYEFQKNISQRTPSQQNQQLLLNRLGVEEARFPRSPLLPSARGRDNSIESHVSQESRGSQWSNPGLHKVRSSGSGAGGKYHTQNLAQLKRHSIADLGNFSLSPSINAINGKHGLNMYNDSTVFETTAVGPRNYAFEQQQHQIYDYIDGVRQRKRISSYEIGHGEKLGTAAHKMEEQADSPMPRFFRSPKFDGRTTNTLDSTSALQYQRSDAVAKKDDEATFAGAKVDNYVDSDDDVSLVDMDGIVQPDEQNIDNEDGESDVTLNSESLFNHIYDDSVYTPTRTQQRKLAIKEELDGTADPNENLPVGMGWMDPANYNGIGSNDSNSTSMSSVTASAVPSIKSKNKKDSNTIWMNSSLKQRNMYEHVTSELRKMVLFSEKPVLNSVTRNRNVQASRTSNGGAAFRQGRTFPQDDVRALVAEMWQEAQGRSLVG